MLADDDLYADLPEDTANDHIDKLESQNEILKQQVRKLTDLLSTCEGEKFNLATQLDVLKQERETLLWNVSSLYKTAKAELARKTNAIEELRFELENRSFRRRHENSGRHPAEVFEEALRKKYSMANGYAAVPEKSENLVNKELIDREHRKTNRRGLGEVSDNIDERQKYRDREFDQNRDYLGRYRNREHDKYVSAEYHEVQPINNHSVFPLNENQKAENNEKRNEILHHRGSNNHSKQGGSGEPDLDENARYRSHERRKHRTVERHQCPSDHPSNEYLTRKGHELHDTAKNKKISKDRDTDEYSKHKDYEINRSKYSEHYEDEIVNDSNERLNRTQDAEKRKHGFRDRNSGERLRYRDRESSRPKSGEHPRAEMARSLNRYVNRIENELPEGGRYKEHFGERLKYRDRESSRFRNGEYHSGISSKCVSRPEQEFRDVEKKKEYTTFKNSGDHSLKDPEFRKTEIIESDSSNKYLIPFKHKAETEGKKSSSEPPKQRVENSGELENNKGRQAEVIASSDKGSTRILHELDAEKKKELSNCYHSNESLKYKSRDSGELKTNESRKTDVVNSSSKYITPKRCKLDAGKMKELFGDDDLDEQSKDKNQESDKREIRENQQADLVYNSKMPLSIIENEINAVTKKEYSKDELREQSKHKSQNSNENKQATVVNSSYEHLSCTEHQSDGEKNKRHSRDHDLNEQPERSSQDTGKSVTTNLCSSKVTDHLDELLTTEEHEQRNACTEESAPVLGSNNHLKRSDNGATARESIKNNQMKLAGENSDSLTHQNHEKYRGDEEKECHQANTTAFVSEAETHEVGQFKDFGPIKSCSDWYQQCTPLKLINGEFCLIPLLSQKLVSPIADTPDHIKEKLKECNNSVKISPVPMINERRVLENWEPVPLTEKEFNKNEGISDVVDVNNISTSDQITGKKRISVSVDMEHGVFKRKRRKPTVL